MLANNAKRYHTIWEARKLELIERWKGGRAEAQKMIERRYSVFEVHPLSVLDFSSFEESRACVRICLLVY